MHFQTKNQQAKNKKRRGSLYNFRFTIKWANVELKRSSKRVLKSYRKNEKALRNVRKIKNGWRNESYWK
jgi:hypothetical protein